MVGKAEIWGAHTPPSPFPSPCPLAKGYFGLYLARLPAGTAARKTAPASSCPGTAAKPTLVTLPSAKLGWKLWQSEGFPGRDTSLL